MVRRLAAIMFTDIAGYTSLSQADEPAALRLLQDQERLVRGLLEIHRGRLVKSMGDGLLIEFTNALDAVECAADLQRHIQERNAREPSPELRVRIGIHLGDVEGAGSDILGDAVNIASRLEPLAEPGGVCLSEPVYGLVHNKVPFHLERLGLKTLKGVLEPLEVYRLVVPERAVAAPPLAKAPGPSRLAVLPLANISPDPKDEYFADGLTEELITVLSQLGGLRVIARTSVVPYKSAPKPVSQIGAELGVSSILEGSVRRAGERLRITVQLIDVGSQEHTWAETYDRRLDDVFAVQSEVAKRVADELDVKLRKSEAARLEEHPPVHPDSYLAYLKGRSLLASDWSEETFRAAKKQFELAVAIDPTNARAYSGLADAVRWLGWGHYEGSWVEWDKAGRAYVARALELDPDLAEAHCSLGMILWNAWDYAGTETELKRALSLNPSYSVAHNIYAHVLMDEGRPEEALREFALWEELDPHSTEALGRHVWLLAMLRRVDQAKSVCERIGRLAPDSSPYHYATGWCYYAQSDFPKALEEWDRASKLAPEEQSRLPRAIVYALTGEPAKSREILEEMERKGGRFAPPDTLAIAYAVLGDYDQAFRILLEAAEGHELALQTIRIEPSLERFREDPRFAQLLAKMNLA